MTFAYETPELTDFYYGDFAAGKTELKEGDDGEQYTIPNDGD